MFKPPKMFHLKANSETVPPPPVQPVPAPENQRVWSPSAISDATSSPIGTVPPQVAEPILSSTPTEDLPKESVVQETTKMSIAPTEEEKTTEPEAISQPRIVPDSEILSDKIETVHQESETINRQIQKEDDFSRYARPKLSQNTDLDSFVSEKNTDPEMNQRLGLEEEGKEIVQETDIQDEEDEKTAKTYKSILNEHKKVIRAPSLNSVPFADIWYTAEKIAYIRDKETPFALIPFETDDMEDFYKALEQGYTGQSSYAIRFAGESYRVERIITLGGVQYNCRKMPGSVPDIYSLGLPKHTVDYLLTLGKESGLLLFGGPTGMGKTTSASALMKKFLEIEGGFMYTIEDPPEMPLEGLYRAKNGGLGLCKQCPVDNERWGDGIKSALRSRPRYILVGEIRTPETASQVLRAATSGHLVLSTIHASTVEDALESLIKYASGAGLTESLAADLLARGILGVIHQKLEGSSVLRPVLTSVFANPHLTGGDQMRSLIRNNTINLQTLIEAQSSRMMQGRPLFGSDKLD